MPDNIAPALIYAVIALYTIFLMVISSRLKTLYPEAKKGDVGPMRHIHLAVGSSIDVVLRGGPYPWFGDENAEHYNKGNCPNSNSIIKDRYIYI